MTIPMNHDPNLWNYSTGPHISLCSAPPGAPPHLHTCHVHNLYQPQFSQSCLQVPPPQFPPNCLPHPHHQHPHHQPHHLGGFPSPPAAMPPSVASQHYAQHAHAHPHHLQPQRPDVGLDGLDLLGDHPVGLHGASTMHVPPAMQVSPPAQLFMTAETRGGQLELLHARRRRPPPPTRTRWHHNLPPLPAPPQYSGFLLHFL